MAAPQEGDNQRGSFLPSQRSPVLPACVPTSGSDADSDDLLLDISQIESLNETPSCRGMDRADGLSSIEKDLLSSDVPDGLNLPEHQHPPKSQQEQVNYQQADDTQAAFVLSSRQKRLNPFDAARHDFWQDWEHSVGKQESNIGTRTVAKQNNVDLFDPLNFGDPTFVNSYSSSPVSRTSASQSPAGIASLQWQPPSLKQPVTEFRGPIPSQALNFQLEPSLPHRNILTSVPRVNLSSPNQSSANTRPPFLPGFKRNTRFDIRSSPTHQQPVAKADVQQRVSSSSVLLSGSAVRTDGHHREAINQDNQDYIDYPHRDLIIEDYTSSSVARNNSSSIVTPKSSNTSPDAGLKQQRSGYSSAFISDANKLTEKQNGTGHQECVDNLQVNSGHMLNVGAAMGDQKRIMVDAFGDDRFRMHSSDVGDRGTGQLGSLYSLDSRGEMPCAEDEGGQSLWDDESESGFLESAPLLDSGSTDKRAFVSTNSPHNRVGNLLATSLRTPAVYSKTDAKGEIASSGCRAIANRQVPYRNFMSKGYKNGESFNQNMREGNHHGAPQGNYNNAQGGDNHACVNQRGGDTERNAYGQLSPLPQFLEQDRVGQAGATLGVGVPYRHCHQQKRMSLTDKLARRQLISVVVLCLLFMIGEGIGGFLANSLALFTDVLHLASDLISFIISLLAMWLANKPATRRMSFGYHRAEVLGAMFSVFIIWLVSGVLCYIAVDRIMHEHYMDVKPDEMLITASLGVLFNIVMGLVLHSEMCCGHAHSHNKFGHGHSHAAPGHGHGHSHGKDELLDVATTQREVGGTGRQGFDYHRLEHPAEVVNHQMRDGAPMAVAAEECSDEFHECAEEETVHKHKNINVRAAFIHVVGDIIQSLGVLIAALIIKFTNDERYRLADPICTFLFSILVLITTVTVLRDALLVVMEGVPRDLSIESLKKELSALNGVITVHSLHIWALTLDRNALSVHLAVENPHTHDQVLSAATKLIQDRHHFFHSTIQVELYNEAVMKNCKECTEWK